MKRPGSPAILLFLLFTAPGATFAADSAFNTLVKKIESHYGTRRTRIPFLGLANAVVKVARPAGARDLKLAVFENLPDSAEDDFHALIGRDLGPGWQSIVRVHSRRDSESVQSTSIYTRSAGRDINLLIATRESQQATLVQLQVSEQLLARWLADPKRMGECIVTKSGAEAPDFCDEN